MGSFTLSCHAWVKVEWTNSFKCLSQKTYIKWLERNCPCFEMAAAKRWNPIPILLTTVDSNPHLLDNSRFQPPSSRQQWTPTYNLSTTVESNPQPFDNSGLQPPSSGHLHPAIWTAGHFTGQQCRSSFLLWSVGSRNIVFQWRLWVSEGHSQLQAYAMQEVHHLPSIAHTAVVPLPS